MKLIAVCLMLFMYMGFSACENHMDIRDVAEGTPTNADTVLPHKFAPKDNVDSAHIDNLPKVFRR
ncbi:MAG: hypothetical protein Q8891_13390 [Bacteroidota bacterium]|jgi:hypothetical protein|nr:hypothetical protein [Bacteroidota bacterium]